MNLSPYYEQIKSRALEILNDPEGWSFVGRGKIDSRKDSKLTAREFFSWKKPNHCRQAIGTALDMARDEVHERLAGTSKRSPWTLTKFGVMQRLQALREISFKIQMDAARAKAVRARYGAQRA